MITLVPMTESDYQVYLAKIVPEYAAEKVEAGNWEEAESLELSRKSFEHYLPQGIHTPGHFLNRMVNEAGQSVGVLWYAYSEGRTDRVWIFDFEVQSAFRRHGYGSQAMRALEALIKPQGVKKIELHVFGSNTVARELYKKAGFVEVNVGMSKTI